MPRFPKETLRRGLLFADALDQIEIVNVMVAAGDGRMCHPLEPTQAVADRLRENGVSVEWVVLDNIAHDQTGRFVDLLRAAAPRIKKAWQ